MSRCPPSSGQTASVFEKLENRDEEAQQCRTRRGFPDRCIRHGAAQTVIVTPEQETVVREYVKKQPLEFDRASGGGA